MIKKYLFLCLVLLSAVSTKAAPVVIVEQGGWFESGYVTWQKTAGMEYNVYVSAAGADSWTLLDDELVREYPTYGRADALGLKAGSYQFKVVPVQGGTEVTADAAVSSAVDVKAHDRSGFAHVGMSGGIGAYKNDGTLKDGAKVLYVWADNAKHVTHDVVTNSKGTTTTGKGLQDIVYLYQKGYEKTPLAIRIIGTIKDSDMDRFDSSAEGLQVKGKNAYADMPITIEGVGNDAAIWGFGILCRNAANVEFRNFAIMLCMDDCLSLDTGNANIWIHNMDFYYGNTGGDSDQAKGDGTVDIKGKSKNITVSYNHFIDCGKTCLGGMKSEDTSCWMTFHHNWFDHSDSRHPRVRTAFYHVYNNYFDGVSKYGVGVTSGGSSFVENNYFRNCKYPMLISKQGTDAEGDGTFSGENGGVIKAFNNKIDNARKVQYYDGSQTDGKWDAVLVSSRDAAVSATAFTGGTSYNSEADSKARTTYIENNMDAPEAVKGIVKGTYGAGRMQHGDFKWSFNNSLQDENYGVITNLKSSLQSYKSTLVGFFDGTSISNGGATATVDAGDGKGIDEATNDAYVPSWGSGGGSGTVTAGKYVIGSTKDFFWFNAANTDAYNNYVSAGTFATTGTFKPDQIIVKSDNTPCSDYVGSIRLAQNQSFTVYYPDGISAAYFYVSGTGTQNWKLETSNDGNSWTAAGTVEGKAGAHPTCGVTPTEAVKYVRLTNTNASNRDLQGVKIATPDANVNPDVDPGDDDEEETKSTDATAEFTLAGEEIAMSGNSYTLNVAYNADDAAGYTVVVTPADKATIANVSGANGSNGTYVIPAPAVGATSTATFRILAENQANTKTYTISIVKGVDPSTIPVTSGEFLYFPTKAPSNTFYTVTSGNYGDPGSYGSITYVRNGETYECTYSLKMESKTEVSFTPTQDGTVKICMGATKYKTRDLKLNGDVLTANDNNIIEKDVTAGTKYTITKSGTAGIFYIDLVYGDGSGQPGGGDDPTPQPSTKTVFSTTATAALSVSALSSVEITSDNATTTGGKIYAVNNFTNDDKPDGEAKNMIKTQSKVVAFQHTNNTTYFKIELDEALQAGDVISSKAYLRDDTAIGLWLTPSEERPSAEPNTKMVSDKISTTGWGELPTYTITADDGLAGVKTFYIHRATDKSTYFTDFTITRPSTTGINNVHVNLNDNGCLYDLMGRRVTAPQTGKVYIQNGKKFIMR